MRGKESKKRAKASQIDVSRILFSYRIYLTLSFYLGRKGWWFRLYRLEFGRVSIMTVDTEEV
ncbi:MAG: hypothetical protein ACPL6D_13210, partial [Thermodesulfobacteriota bacterium]